MKKYLFVVPSLSNGGAERVVTVLSSGLASNGIDVTVLRYFKTDADYPIDERVNVITLSDGYESDYLKINKIKMLRKLGQIIKKEDPDYIIPFLRYVNLHTYLSCGHKYRKRIIFTLRNSPFTKRGLIEKTHDFLVNNLNKTIVQTNAQKKYFKAKAHKHIEVLNNPVNEIFLDAQRNKADNSFLVVSAGRLNSQKNFSMLITAFANFSQDKPNVCLHIYGDGEKSEELHQLINKLNCSEKIKLMGRTNDLVNIYNGASLYILSSNFEGMPNALLEAMAIGLPCIATDCPTGPSEMIVNEENGLLVPVGDVEKMQEAIEFMYNNRDQAEKMGKHAREFVSENYRIEKIVDRFLEIVDQK